ncbi:MAG: phenylalanine 4-monooxygenase [Saprospiraceae bacterium]
MDTIKTNLPDPAVWKILFERQIENLQDKACRAYLDGIARIGFRADEVPTLEGISSRLTELTGWRVQRVPGIVEAGEFLRLLSQRIFPSTYFLRSMSQLDYLEEPDMFHDLFGHLPLVGDPAFSNFYEKLGRFGEKFAGNAEAIDRLERFYWYTVEFGLMEENGNLRIYGSGILSSYGESRFVYTDEPEIRNFDLEAILNLPFDKSQIQPIYFVVPSFDFLFEQLELLEEKVMEQASVA